VYMQPRGELVDLGEDGSSTVRDIPRPWSDIIAWVGRDIRRTDSDPVFRRRRRRLRLGTRIGI
jgi:hypothetical protein